MNLTASLEKLAAGYWNVLNGKQQDAAAHIHAAYGQDLTSDQKMRSRTCGATIHLLLGQRSPNRLLSQQTNCKHVGCVTFTLPSEGEKDRIEKEISDHLKETGTVDILEPERKHMAGFWATQQEVKQALRDVNEVDEQAAKRYGGSDQRSQSSTVRKNWDLDRTKIKEILAHLAEDGELQTTFGNFMGATGFKASRQGKLSHTVCPNCKTAADTRSHCVACYQLEVVEIKNGKQ